MNQHIPTGRIPNSTVLGKTFAPEPPAYMQLCFAEPNRVAELLFTPECEASEEGQVFIVQINERRKAYFPARASTIELLEPDGAVRVTCPLWWALYCGLAGFIDCEYVPKPSGAPDNYIKHGEQK